MASQSNFAKRCFHKLAAVQTGVVLLIVVGLVSAAGTFILQRPMTEAEQMQRAYSPEALRWLDRLGLTDVFHAWWFAALLALVGISIACASVERFPKAWRLLTRPYRRPEPHFRAGLAMRRQFPVRDASRAMAAAETALRGRGLKPQRLMENDEVSLYAERNRFAVLSVYVVHASILLILAGGIVDAVWGWKGYLTMTPGQTVNQVEQRDGKSRALPFALRCDGTGQENYADGSPKRWWSRLVVLEDGRETLKKEIVVNDPLVREGIRFYQSGYGQTGEVESLLLNVRSPERPGETRQITLRPEQGAALDAENTARLAQFIPDFVIRDGQIYARSREMVNPAFQLAIESKGKSSLVWVFPQVGRQEGDTSYQFEMADAQMAAYTGLQVSHEPGQWAVWAGCLLLGAGLILAFYCVYQRYWAIAFTDAQGKLTLWLGSAAEKNCEHYAELFHEMADEIERELGKDEPRARAKRSEPQLAGTPR